MVMPLAPAALACCSAPGEQLTAETAGLAARVLPIVFCFVRWARRPFDRVFAADIFQNLREGETRAEVAGWKIYTSAFAYSRLVFVPALFGRARDVVTLLIMDLRS